MENNKKTHPAYGTLLFNNTYGSKRSLFGSSIKHNNTITMSLYHADVTRELNNDHIHGHKKLAEVEMSYSQFAEAISSFGMNSGVPVTIKYTEKDGQIPDCDFVSKQEQFVDEFADERENILHESTVLIEEVANLFSSKKNITKADREAIISKLKRLHQDLTCNMDFIVNQFNKQMDKTVSEAKGEIEAFCQNRLDSIAKSTLMQTDNDAIINGAEHLLELSINDSETNKE